MKLHKPLVIAFFFTFAALAVIPSASAAADITPPTLNLAAASGFVSVSTIGAMAPDGEGYLQATGELRMNIRWTASDGSGICGSSHRAVYAGSAPALWSSWSSSMSLSYVTSDYEDQFGGGGGHIDGYGLTYGSGIVRGTLRSDSSATARGSTRRTAPPSATATWR